MVSQVPRAGSSHTDASRRPLRPGGFCPGLLFLHESTSRCIPTPGTALPAWPGDAPDAWEGLSAGTAQQLQGAPREQGGDTAVTPAATCAVTLRDNQRHRGLRGLGKRELRSSILPGRGRADPCRAPPVPEGSGTPRQSGCVTPAPPAPYRSCQMLRG